MLGSGSDQQVCSYLNNEAAKAKAEELRAKIAPKQGKLGIVGIIVGAWMIVASFMFSSCLSIPSN